MAGHSKFKNIMHRKGKQDALRAKKFTKVIREIEAAVRQGIDSEFNPRLRAAIFTAKALNVPKDKIENAIKKGSGEKGTFFEDIRYEGYGPGGVAVIIEALTDNRNRTAGEVRSAFTKSGGSLGETNSVNYLFNHVGYLEYTYDKKDDEKILEIAFEAGISDYEFNNDYLMIECPFEKLNYVKEYLLKNLNIEPLEAKIIWKPQTLIKIKDKEKAEKILKLIDLLEENDDIQSVFTNQEFDNTLLDES